MINNIYVDKVFLAPGSTDMRKSIDGLAAIVQEKFLLDPFSSYLFVFCNRAREKIKILHWQHNGFWLYYRRLEKGKFQWPENSNSKHITITRRELNWILDGLSLNQTDAHKKVTASVII